MKMTLLFWVLTLAILQYAVSLPIEMADLFFGSEGGGHTFPGATRPFGMVKMGVDVIDSPRGEAYAGYSPEGKIVGVSMMHESGTGGLPQYGVVSQLPYLGKIDYTTQLFNERAAHDVANPGEYTVKFGNGVALDLVAGDRVGIYGYTFPKGSEPQIVVNSSHHLITTDRPYWSQKLDKSSITASEDLTEYTGETTIKGGWGYERPWTIYYCGTFNTTPKNVTSFSGYSHRNSRHAKSKKEDDSTGLVFHFPQGKTYIESRVGISYISTEKACSNLLHESGPGFEKSAMKQTSKDLWNKNVFDKVSVKSNNATLHNMLYSALYGAYLSPTNKTGENPTWNSTEPYYDDFFTMWDTFRCLNPMFNVLSPSRGADIIRSLIDIYRHEGFMPDGRAANQNGKTQGGSNADIVLSDAFIKNITTGINWEEGYEAMVNDAEVEPPYFFDEFAPDASTLQGRGGLSDWLKYGWVTRNFTRSITRTLEYSYDDYALSVVAEGLGKKEELIKYLKRSANWQNLWNFNASSDRLDYTGFLQPKNSKGEFNERDYDPLNCGDCYWENDEYEGKPIEYGWAVPQDIKTLKKFIGSDKLFIHRLDDMFNLKGKNLADIGNEPSFLTPYLYNFVNEQWRTVEIMRYIINNNYTVGAKGLPGNADAGAMHSYLFWALIGMYPVAGTTTYLLSSPFFEQVVLNLENGKQVRIDAKSLSSTSIYVQSVKVNGKPWHQNWITHEEIFANGGFIEFQLGEKPIVWETGSEPPSPGHYALI